VTASCLGVVNLVWGGEVSTHRQEKLKEPLYTLVISRVKKRTGTRKTNKALIGIS
jgi:hypothetical protein